MKVQLRFRSYGVHSLVKEIEVEGRFSDYCENTSKWDYKIDEDKLIDNLPKDFLPTSPNKILVTIGNDAGSTGQIHLNRFRNWAKYFDCYVLELVQDT